MQTTESRPAKGRAHHLSAGTCKQSPSSSQNPFRHVRDMRFLFRFIVMFSSLASCRFQVSQFIGKFRYIDLRTH